MLLQLIAKTFDKLFKPVILYIRIKEMFMQVDMFEGENLDVLGGYFRAMCVKEGVSVAAFTSLYRGIWAYSQEFGKTCLYNPSRKWEVVSAYQKAVRRGDARVALKMVDAIVSTKDVELIQYLWKRVVVTAAEDIGPANPEIVAFSIACQMFFIPKKYPEHQYRVLGFLTECMCASQKSRVLCDMVIISERCSGVGIPGLLLTEAEQSWVSRVLKAKELEGDSDLLQLIAKKDWRTEGMGKFLPLAVRDIDFPLPDIHDAEASEVTVVKGIPSYAYDMHTRIGRKALTCLTGVRAVHPFISNCGDKVKALGWALFFAEGGKCNRERQGVEQQNLFSLCKKVGLCSLGVAVQDIDEMIATVEALIPKLNEFRAGIAGRTYGA